MFFQLDQYDHLKDKASDGLTTRLTEKVRSYAESVVAPAYGRLWMWNESGGIFLFPFDGENYSPVTSCIRMMLSRRIYNVEVIGSTILYTYRVALHLGNTVYQERGKTNHIISDAVNFIHHLGSKRLEEGSFLLTGELHDLLPESLKNTFSSAGSFEGKSIFRFELPLYL
jgi:hypothetical protein